MDHEIRINSALGKILRNFNFLELNLGLCLRFLANPDDPSASHGYLHRVGMRQAIDKLHGYLERCEHITDLGDFKRWSEGVEEIRQLRNYYVHATWEYLPRCKDAPLGFRIPPWRTEKIRGSEKGRMRIEDLEEDAERIETAFNEFMAIRQKYRV